MGCCVKAPVLPGLVVEGEGQDRNADEDDAQANGDLVERLFPPTAGALDAAAAVAAHHAAEAAAAYLQQNQHAQQQGDNDRCNLK